MTDDIEDVVAKLNAAKQEQKELEAKLQSTPKTLATLPDAVYGGLEYYREQVAAMADSTGEQAIDAGKRAILANLLGEIRLRPVKGTRELEAEFGVGAAALPNVMPAGSASAYIVVAGARFSNYRRRVALRSGCSL